MSIPEKQQAIHGPSYGCQNEHCRTEQSFPPEDLFWVDAHETECCEKVEAGWYCDYCAHALLHPEAYNAFSALMRESLSEYLNEIAQVFAESEGKI